MELKEYQQNTLKRVKAYLEALNSWRDKNEKVVAAAGREAALDVPLKAWEEIGGTHYRSRKNGLGESLPNFCLKIPTGGGKTLLAAHTVDLVNRIYRKKQTGLILWVVPTTQIYRQTIEHLRNRDHSYRQVLDIASGGRTMICEKTDRFTPGDAAENLVVLMLMLPSASRQNKETLKVFKDSGGFGAFFPKDDDARGHAKLLERFPNLDAFGDGKGLFQRQVKTSLGNTLRILSPIIILDEGHKAYSETAQDTLRGLNPSVIVELSATPTEASNVLVEIKGLDLKREDMIKLDLHINNKESTRWKDTMLASIKKREALEAAARKYEANSGNHIRPICLVQVERTGKDQRGGNFIHAEDVREFLVKEYGVPADEVAVKSSEKDDIEGINLFARNCPIRYIITKQALQEGWDCAFAYVLTILTNPSSKNNLTQLVGRILRQPFARKTKIRVLDESYVFCFRQKAKLLVDAVREGFGREGLGDLAGQVVMDSPDDDDQGEELIELRDKFKKFAGKIYLPKFVIQQGAQWREVSYETDIVSRIDWSQADFSAEKNLQLADAPSQDAEIIVTLSGDTKSGLIKESGRQYLTAKDSGVDPVFATRQLLEIIPNPWIAHDVVKEVIGTLTRKNGLDLVAKNFVFIVQELVKRADAERNRLAEEVFSELVGTKKLRFLLLKDDAGYRLPSKISMRKGTRKLVREDNSPLQLSLFEQVPEDGLNSEERSVAWYFEKQAQLLWWYRNLSRQDYRLQGWRKHGIYPDFIVSRISTDDKTDFDKVFVVESKGIHLKNDDTDYKKQFFKVCNKLAEEKSWTELGLEFPERKIVFELVHGDEWQKVMNALLK
ncbi:MAG TPA: DEAD/DEAH box helicase family protein [Verrucomicrobiota bacterium]|nr:DEAD/DEAH box helicase family protein [Verrucomicrobiota bacterium]HNT15301.1 DEAD/DEAH box helicase family protein [Verrucomicrobiota bacterium]